MKLKLLLCLLLMPIFFPVTASELIVIDECLDEVTIINDFSNEQLIDRYYEDVIIDDGTVFYSEENENVIIYDCYFEDVVFLY